MKPLLSIFVLLASSLLLLHCKRDIYTASNFPAEQLVFGFGGGISGATTSYHLLPNGQFFRANSLTSDTVAVPSLKKGVAKQLLAQFAEQQMDTVDFQHPGNKYYFLRKMSADSTYEITWGDLDYPAPEAVKSLYDELKKLIPQQ